jgi:predicted nucleic acid-binding protein
VASETFFIYLRAWIIQNKKIAPRRVLRYLKRHREVLNEVDFHKPLALVSLLRVLPLNSAVLQTSHSLMTRYQLLPADSVDAALIRRHNLPAIATRDDDFDHIGSLDVYKP